MYISIIKCDKEIIEKVFDLKACTMCDAPVNKCASLFILASYEPDMSP